MGVKLGNGNWAVKEDKLLAYNDKSGKFFNKEFDFTRGSSATYVAKDGLIKTSTGDTPRIDFSDSPKGALLLEPSSTNLVEYSEDFSQWTNVRSNGVDNQITAPDGTTTAYKLIDTTENNTHLLISNQTVTTSDVFAFSMFLKKGSLENGFIAFDSTINQSVVFNLQNGTIVSTGAAVISSKIENFGNDWYRCSLTHIPNSTSRNYRVGTYNGNISYTGSGNDFIYCWGAQLEQNSFATSYIPTYGTTATRLAETCTNSGSAQDFNSDEGVLYAEIGALSGSSSQSQIELGDGSDSTQIKLGWNNDRVLTSIQLNNTSVLIFQYNTASDLLEQEYYKVAVKYKSGQSSVFIDGVERATSSTTYTSTDTISQLGFQLWWGGTPFYGKVRNLKVYTEALTDAELQELTS